MCVVFFSSRRRHTRLQGDWSSDVCSSDLRLVESFEPDTLIVTRPAIRVGADTVRALARGCRSAFWYFDEGSAVREDVVALGRVVDAMFVTYRSEEHTSELQSPCNIVCRLL